MDQDDFDEAALPGQVIKGLAGSSDIAEVGQQDDPLVLAVTTRSGQQFTSSLHNLRSNLLRSDESERDRLIGEQVSAILAFAGLSVAPTAEPNLEEVVPTLQGESWVRGAAAPALAVEPMVGDLSIVYAFDRDGSFVYANWEQLDRFGLDRLALLHRAMDNLRRRLPADIGSQGDGKSFIFTAGGNYEASLILLDEVWTQVAQTMPGDILACPLARDICIVSSTKTVGGVESLIAARDRVCAQGMPANFISSIILRRQGQLWRPFAQ